MLYTIGEIYRLGLLKNYNGDPYGHKSTVSKIVTGMDYKIKKTPWGDAKCLTEKQIEEYNSRWMGLAQ